jgi:TPP-dependent pyruvate/acetoin dehydrogenase alpha subunit
MATEIDGAVAFAEGSPDPEVADMFTDVYAPY